MRLLLDPGLLTIYMYTSSALDTFKLYLSIEAYAKRLGAKNTLWSYRNEGNNSIEFGQLDSAFDSTLNGEYHLHNSKEIGETAR